VKNADDPHVRSATEKRDSPQTAMADLHRLHGRWLAATLGVFAKDGPLPDAAVLAAASVGASTAAQQLGLLRAALGRLWSARPLAAGPAALVEVEVSPLAGGAVGWSCGADLPEGAVPSAAPAAVSLMQRDVAGACDGALSVVAQMLGGASDVTPRLEVTAECAAAMAAVVQMGDAELAAVSAEDPILRVVVLDDGTVRVRCATPMVIHAAL
jgi:hypothetical protein